MQNLDKMNLNRNKGLKAPRAWFHDYSSPGFYLITITAYENRLPLSVIPDSGTVELLKGEMIIPQNTPAGEAVKENLSSLSRKNPLLKIIRYVIMPDHIHFVIQVTKKLEKPLGKYIAPFTAACSQAYNRLYAPTSFQTLFKPFDDRIIFNYQQLDRSIKYVEDNPRRYLIRRRHVDLFQRHFHLTIGNHEYAAYGNLFLLKEIYLLQVRIHRRWSDRQFKEYEDFCEEEMSKGAVLISPAIHPVEKRIIRTGIERGGSVIILRDLAFNERFKPQGEYFDLCAEGRLLFLAPWPENLKRSSMSGYREFHKMNDYAASIASLPSEARLILHNGPAGR